MTMSNGTVPRNDREARIPADRASAATARSRPGRCGPGSRSDSLSPRFALGGLGAWIVPLSVAVTAAALLVARHATTANVGSAPSSERPGIKSIAVLPLRNLTGDARQDWFTESLTQELTSAVSRLSGLRVISGISARQYKGSVETAPEIARELGGIDGLLDGSVTRDGDRLRIAVYLDEPVGNRRIWADTYERSLGDSPHLLDEIAGRVALEMGATLTLTKRSGSRWHASSNRTPMNRICMVSTFVNDRWTAVGRGRAVLPAGDRDRRRVCRAACGTRVLLRSQSVQRSGCPRPMRSREGTPH